MSAQRLRELSMMETIANLASENARLRTQISNIQLEKIRQERDQLEKEAAQEPDKAKQDATLSQFPSPPEADAG